MTKDWTFESLRALTQAYMPAAALMAAAELDVFGLLADGPRSAPELATGLGADLRAVTILADALTAVGLLEKRDGRYAAAPGTLDTLTADGAASALPYVQHHANSFRAWTRLAEVVQTGLPASVDASIRGAEADHTAYIDTMAVVGRQAPEVIAAIDRLGFEHFLDVGCGPAAWAIALLRAVPGCRATLFDLPEVLPIARKNVEAAGLQQRVTFVAGDYRADEPLPAGADMVWVSAIAHMNSRRQNRELFTKAHAALPADGQIMIRDVVMDEAHTEPRFGALFAVLMLLRTEAGGTYSFEEFRQDLAEAGFEHAELFRHELGMDSIIRARKTG